MDLDVEFLFIKQAAQRLSMLFRTVIFTAETMITAVIVMLLSGCCMTMMAARILRAID